LQLADSKRELHAEKVILCIGGQARRPTFDGAEFGTVPEEFFSLKQMPKSIAIIGSGYTGVQMCSVMNAFGWQVTLLDVAPAIVPSTDEMVSTVLRERFEALGVVAAENAVLGPNLEHQPELLPSGGFTDPDHAGFGLTEREARGRKLNFISASADYARLDRAIIDGRKHGFVKLIADRRTGIRLGAHAIGENALELIQGLAISMAAGVTLRVLATTRPSYPTYSAIVGELARRMWAEQQRPALSCEE